MSSIPEHIFLVEQVREMDRMAIGKCDIPGYTLMQRAGKAAFELFRTTWPNAREVVVVAGPGNNGGDGYVIARLARSAGMQVHVLQSGDHSRLSGDAARARDEYLEHGGQCIAFDAQQGLPECDLIIDALLGSGLTRAVEGEFAVLIQAMNAHPAPILSVDVPSGLDADRGVALGETVSARATMTFVGMKLGLMTGAGCRHAGSLYFDGLQIPDEVSRAISACCHRVSLDGLHSLLGMRAPDAHKGDFGHVLLVGGNAGMAGSVTLAAQAAARAGSGLVSVATVPQHAGQISAACPEVMAHGVHNSKELEPLIRRATVLAIGPGLGQDPWARDLLSKVLELDLPTVVDADALNLLALDPVQKESWVLTPHPGEAARLLKTTTREIQQHRLERARALQEQYGGVCVLKGCGTLVAAQEQVSVCSAGNPGMASGGMGDVLTGIIAGLLAQGLELYDAARYGVQLHARSADMAALDGQRGLLASDLFSPLRSLVNADRD